MGVNVKNVDISLGEISVNLNEDLISKKKKSSDTHVDEPVQAATESEIIAKKQQKKEATLAAITKHTPFFPEKVSDCFLPVFLKFNRVMLSMVIHDR